MKRLGQKICVAVVLSLAVVAIWHDSATAAMPVIASIGQIKDSTVRNPTRIDVDAAGTIYLCDGRVNGVTRYDKYGQVLPTLRGAYTVTSNGVAVTPDGRRVFVSVAEPGKTFSTAVAVIDGSTGVLLGYLGVGFNEFARVGEIDLDGKGNIYVGNYDKSKTIYNLNNTAQINVYNGSTYAKLYSFGKPSSSLVSGYYQPLPGEFGEISGLTVDVANEEVLVAEAWNNNGYARVQIFGLDGTFKRNRPEPSIVGTQINCKPISLTVDPSGRVYLLSILTGTIHVFTAHPEAYLGKFTKGTPDPAFDANNTPYPWTVGMIPCPSFDTVYDPLTGRLFVVTDGNGIQIFSVDGSTNPVRTNRAPEMPAMTGPVQGSEVVTLTPTLQWAAALDADGDTPSYNVQIVDADGAVVITNNNVTTTNLSVAAGILRDNKKYGWKVQAADAEFTSAYSAVENFWVNAVEEAPTASLLVAPATETRADKDTIFSWQAATDADPFDTVTYRLEIAGNADFTTPLISVKQGGLSSATLSTLPGYDDLQSGTTYNWRVVAVDSTGLTTASEVRSFFRNRAPAAPEMLSPLPEQEVATVTPTLLWAAALDADGDTLSYNVQIVDVSGAVVSANNNIATTSLDVAGNFFLENNKYGWQVQAADADLVSAYSAVQYFWVNAVEEVPTAPVVVAPAAAATVDKDTIFSWQAVTDADPLATVTYRLEIATGEDFTTPLIAVQQGELSSSAFSTLPGYADLQPETTYQWRVVAVDNIGLTTASEVRSFTYSSTVLSVDATFPGAKVYLGGNSAYRGRYVGEVPLELRDINPGTIEVVVERTGFEPWVKSVVVAARQGVAVHADLVVAILPGEFKKAALLAGGLKIQVGAEAAPVLVDFDSDGLNDLLVADGSGKLLLYKGVAGAEWPVLSGLQLPGVILPVGAVPFVADWNNDDRKDLLVGAADGSVSLFLNVGTQQAPVFTAATPLQADNAPLNVAGGNATPLLFDLNDDGKKDLLVGCGDGALYSFLNTGSDEAPLLAAGKVLIAAAANAANASALVADWDADGDKEILLAANQEVALYERQVDGSYAQGAPLLVHQSLYSTTTRTYAMQCSSFGQKIRIIAANTDGVKGKDLLIGNAAGEILLAYSTMNKVSAISPFFAEALSATVTEIEKVIPAQLAATLGQLKANIQSSAVNKLLDYKKASSDLASLQAKLSADAEISVLLTKLQIQLNSEIPLN